MSLLQSLLNTLGTWRQRWHNARPRRTARRPNVAFEQLDHRRLLSVTFTGNAKADIPDNSGPGFAIVTNSQRVEIPDPALRNLIKVSGFDISAIRMFYDPSNDVLSVALEQPGNQKTIPEFPVIAGDSDNNLNGGTVSPAVLAVQPLFSDYPFLGESETMHIFLDLNNDSIPDVVAGISNDPGVSKLYQVAEAVVNPDPVIAANSDPAFGTTLQSHTGFAFLQNADPTAGAFEFQILKFSELYLAETGQPLQANSTIGVGAFAGSPDDFATELFIKARPVNFGVVPPTPPECPPLSPPIKVNPHQHRHVNVAHPGFVRVTVFGTSGFDVDNIVVDTVRFGGAQPAFYFKRRIDRDEFKDVTFVFRGNDLNFPPGIQVAHLTGLYNDPTTHSRVTFDSARIIFVRGDQSSAQVQAAEARRERRPTQAPITQVPEFIRARAQSRGVDLVLEQWNVETADSGTPANIPTVVIPARRNPRVSSNGATPGSPTAHFRRQGPVKRVALRLNQNDAPASESTSATSTTVPRNHADPNNPRWASVVAGEGLDALDVHDLAIASMAS